MAQQRMAPSALLEQTNLTGVVGNIQDDPDSPDANWLVATSNSVNTVARAGFGTPTNPPTVGAALQEFRARVRKNSSNSGNPTAQLQLYENGILVASGSSASVTSTTGQVISLTWNASSLGTSDGSLVECRVNTTAAGGGPSVRNSVDIGAIEWNAETSAVAAALAGNAIGQAVASGILTTQIPLIGAALTIAAATGDLIAGGGAATLEGEAAANSAATGALTAQISLAGSMASVTSASGALTTLIQLDGGAIAQAIAAAGLTAGISLSASSVANAAGNGNLSALINLVAAAASVTQTGGWLDTQIQLAGAAVAVAEASAQMVGGSAQLSGAALAAASANAGLTTQILLSGDALMIVMASGAMGSDAAALAGNANLQVQAMGDITASIRLTADMLAQAIATGSLVTEILLTATAFAEVMSSGELTVESLHVTPSRRRHGAVVMVSTRPRKPANASAGSAAYPAARRPANNSTRRRTWH
jgi:hypothetical protein